MSKKKATGADINLWSKVGYICSSTNCGTCRNGSDWDKDNKGYCTKLDPFKFIVHKFGICKYHTSLNK